jgi:hypothetical protein
LLESNLPVLKQLASKPEEKTGKDKPTRLLKFNLNGKILAQVGIGKDFNPISNEIELQGKYSGPEMIAGYNIEYLIDVLESYGDIILNIENELSPLTGVPVKDNCLNLALVMPMKVNG